MSESIKWTKKYRALPNGVQFLGNNSNKCKTLRSWVYFGGIVDNTQRVKFALIPSAYLYVKWWQTERNLISEMELFLVHSAAPGEFLSERIYQTRCSRAVLQRALSLTDSVTDPLWKYLHKSNTSTKLGRYCLKSSERLPG